MVLSDDQRDIGRTVRAFLDDHAPLSQRRDGGEASLWERLSEGLGLTNLTLPEDHGGLGLGMAELAAVAEELGRALVASPLVAAVLPSQAPSVPSWLAVDLDGLQQVREGTSLAVAARGAGAAWSLTGSVSVLEGGAHADGAAVVADTDAGPRLFVVDPTATGASLVPLAGIDLTHSRAQLQLHDVAGALLAVSLERVADLATVLVAAEQLGGIGWCLHTAVEYSKVRFQFGRPIGSFQAVKHACADMYVAWELATSAVRDAAWTADHEPLRLPAAADLAKAVASRAYFAAARDTIQLLGGIAYTWEHDAHLFYRRAISTRDLLGSPGWHEQRLLAAAESEQLAAVAQAP
jgi:alkylation response protein AidB-like acyl-CoA dehydrogenase